MGNLYNRPSSGHSPLELRLKRVKQGLVTDRKVLHARLTRMYHFPLKNWFQSDPQRLAALCQAVPAIGRHMTFGQAAAILFDLRDTQQGRENMWLLYSPLLDIDRHMIKGNDGSAYYWGTR